MPVQPALMCSITENSTANRAKSSATVSARERDEAFNLLVARHTRLMFRIAFSLLRNTQDAEDAVQEAFLKLHRSTAWKRMENEKAFLAKTVWRVALDRLPKGKEQPIDEMPGNFVSKGESPESNAMRSAQAASLRKMIDALPRELRQVLLLGSIDELNSREIAELIGIPEGTVRTRTMRAREELRRRFEVSEKRLR